MQSEPNLNVKKDIIEKILYDVVFSVADTVGKAKQKCNTTGPNLNTQKTLNEWKGQVPWQIVKKIEGLFTLENND